MPSQSHGASRMTMSSPMTPRRCNWDTHCPMPNVSFLYSTLAALMTSSALALVDSNCGDPARVRMRLMSSMAVLRLVFISPRHSALISGIWV